VEEKMISTRERQEIKYLQKNSFSADTISKSMNIPVEEICDILGYPKDKVGRVTAHKDYNFYNHGHGDNLYSRFSMYGLYLQEGDFEKYQPACYMDHDSDEFLNLKADAQHIIQSDDNISEARRNWILMRFPIYQEAEWTVLLHKYQIARDKIPDNLKYFVRKST